MGCDIHTVLEQYWEEGERWVGIANGVCDDRNYTRFGMLAGVREEGPDAKGLPSDASDMALMLYDRDDDLHSHSYNDITEFMDIFCRTEHMDDTQTKAYMQAMIDGRLTEWAMREFMNLRVEEERNSIYRVVYCFDN